MGTTEIICLIVLIVSVLFIVVSTVLLFCDAKLGDRLAPWMGPVAGIMAITCVIGYTAQRNREKSTEILKFPATEYTLDYMVIEFREATDTVYVITPKTKK